MRIHTEERLRWTHGLLVSLFDNELEIYKVEASDWMDAARKAMPGNAEWFDEMGDISQEDFYSEFFDADSLIKIERLDELSSERQWISTLDSSEGQE
jgi:hypothetical protein